MRELRRQLRREQPLGLVVEEQLRRSLVEAGATIEVGTTQQRLFRDIVQKIDILLTSIPYLPEFHEPIAIQVTLDSRIGRKTQIFLQKSALTARRRIYLMIKNPGKTPINRQFAELLLATIRTYWLQDESLRRTLAVGITVDEHYGFEIYKLEQRINQNVARVRTATGLRLRGRVISYYAEKKFGFIECTDCELQKQGSGRFEFFFRISECEAAIAERLMRGETRFDVSFTNRGYDRSATTSSPIALQVQSLEHQDQPPVAAPLSTPFPPISRQALRSWMQNVYHEMGIPVAVSNPPLLETEEQLASEQFRLHPLFIPHMIGPLSAAGRAGYWVAVETYGFSEEPRSDPLVRLFAGRTRLKTAKANLEAGLVEWIAPQLGFSTRHTVRLPTPEEQRFTVRVLNWLRDELGADLPAASNEHPHEWVQSDPEEYGIASPTEYQSGDDRRTAPFHILVEFHDE